jgi:hypothetical protein
MGALLIAGNHHHSRQASPDHCVSLPQGFTTGIDADTLPVERSQDF